MIDEFKEAIQSWESIDNLNDFLTAYYAAAAIKENIKNSAANYTKYVQACDYAVKYLEESGLDGKWVDFLKDYLEGSMEPCKDYPNGGYLYIMEKRDLNDDAITAEIAFVNQMLENAIAGGITAGTEITRLMANSDFANEFEGWTTEYEGGSITTGGVEGRTKIARGLNNNSFNFYQTLQNLPAGLYKVSVSGFWREGSGDNQANIVNNGGTLNHNAYLYAGDQKVMLENIASCPDFVPGIASQSSVAGSFPNWPAEVFEYFETGAYKNTVEVTVEADGQLTIGVAIDQKMTYGDWVVIDNFRLTYLGGASTSFEVTVGEAGYVTFVAPFDIAELPEGVEAYACQTQENFVHLEPVTAIPAGEAVVLKNTGTYQFSPATSTVELGADNDLLASNGNVLGGANIYVLAKPEGQAVGFYPTTTGTSIPEGKGYLFIQGSNIKKFYGFDEDDATSINEELSVKNEESAIYNVAGQRLSKQQNQRSTYVKGINIVDGKKILR